MPIHQVPFPRGQGVPPGFPCNSDAAPRKDQSFIELFSIAWSKKHSCTGGGSVYCTRSCVMHIEDVVLGSGEIHVQVYGRRKLRRICYRGTVSSICIDVGFWVGDP